MSSFTRTVWLLSMVSLFTDLASEMLYPVVPIYLKTLGYSMASIGLLEGVAEAMVGLSRGYFGKASDRLGRRLPFVKTGYALSALSKPLMAISSSWGTVFTARLTDRLGKGIRTAPRDALLSHVSTEKTKGSVFGFHRAWDTAGAVAGPLMAWVFLFFFPGAYRTLFVIAFIPGLISVILLFAIKENAAGKKPVEKHRFFSYLAYFRQAPSSYRWLVSGLFIFSVANSSDVFLILKMNMYASNDGLALSAYIFYNLVYAISAYPLGALADRIGFKKVLLSGLALFTLTYAGFALLENHWLLFGLFGLYGLYAAATEGVAKAWISNMVPQQECGTALGFYGASQSIGMLIASTTAGWAWEQAGSAAPFALAAFLAMTAMFWLSRSIK